MANRPRARPGFEQKNEFWGARASRPPFSTSGRKNSYNEGAVGETPTAATGTVALPILLEDPNAKDKAAQKVGCAHRRVILPGIIFFSNWFD
jgi:hypothetical protein